MHLVRWRWGVRGSHGRCRTTLSSPRGSLWPWSCWTGGARPTPTSTTACLHPCSDSRHGLAQECTHAFLCTCPSAASWIAQSHYAFLRLQRCILLYVLYITYHGCECLIRQPLDNIGHINLALGTLSVLQLSMMMDLI